MRHEEQTPSGHRARMAFSFAKTMVDGAEATESRALRPAALANPRRSRRYGCGRYVGLTFPLDCGRCRSRPLPVALSATPTTAFCRVWTFSFVILEIVLGIDNLVFVTILAKKPPRSQQNKAVYTGLSMALVTLTTPLFSVFSHRSEDAKSVPDVLCFECRPPLAGGFALWVQALANGPIQILKCLLKRLRHGLLEKISLLLFFPDSELLGGSA